MQGVLYLRDKSHELWISGKEMSINEGRVKSKSKRNKNYAFDSKKPLCEDWNVSKVKFLFHMFCLGTSVNGYSLFFFAFDCLAI